MSNPLPYISAVSLLLGSVPGLAADVTSINGITVRREERDWTLQSPCGSYGLVQFSELTPWTTPESASVRPTWVRRTSIFFGGKVMTVRLPAVTVALIGAAALSSLVLAAIFWRGKTLRGEIYCKAEPGALPNGGRATSSGGSGGRGGATVGELNRSVKR
jgi:hypothetical protein